MPQLSDDCFATGGPLMSVDEAVALLGERVPVVAGIETVPLAEADGRVAAEDIAAGMRLPPHDNSAVDGYAVRHADLALAGETRLPLRGRIAAGASPDGISAAGRAVRIFTGAPMPADADMVFMQEDVRAEGGFVHLPPGLAQGANRRLAGEDVRIGEVVVPEGRRLRPQDVALLGGLGESRVAVRRKLRVALFSTGNELVAAGAPLGPGQIHDSNRLLLAGMLRRLGAEVHDLGILRDDPEALGRTLAEVAPEHDLVLTSGGVSTGDEDHVRGALERVGHLVFWRLAIKPGRPVAMGHIGGTAFVGLPGNPVAAYVTMLVLVAPLLARLGGAASTPVRGWPIRAGFAYSKKAGRREYLRVGLREGADGAVELAKFPRDGTGILSSLVGSDGLADLPEALTAIAPGDLVTFIPHLAMPG